MDALRVLTTPTNQIGMGALNSAMNGHNECAARDKTWCDCAHKVPMEPRNA